MVVFCEPWIEYYLNRSLFSICYYICAKADISAGIVAQWLIISVVARWLIIKERDACMSYEWQPENLLVDVSPSQPTPLLKLVDFGDARHIYDDAYIHRLMGSAEFAAPELITGRPASLLSDIWSALLFDVHFLITMFTDWLSSLAVCLVFSRPW